jgi:hypothetical protein
MSAGQDHVGRQRPTCLQIAGLLPFRPRGWRA